MEKTRPPTTGNAEQKNLSDLLATEKTLKLVSSTFAMTTLNALSGFLAVSPAHATQGRGNASVTKSILGSMGDDFRLPQRDSSITLSRGPTIVASPCGCFVNSDVRKVHRCDAFCGLLSLISAFGSSCIYYANVANQFH
eukprot:COSAG01_NODE_229_length_21089_cov_575.019194_2_plen_139_part_00